MTCFHKCSIWCVILLIILGCSNQSNSEKKNIRNKDANIATYELPAENNSRFIHFFGIELQGQYEEIVKNIYSLPMLSLVERRDSIKLQGNGDKWFSHTVEFCGVPWGMTADFTMNEDNIISIHNLTFITSKTDDDIIIKVVKELTKHYGEPDISDDKEEIYHWFEPNDLSIRARHFRASEGGWTFYFYIN